MTKARANNPRPKETTWMIQTAHRPEDIDKEPEFFSTVGRLICGFPYQDIQVVSKYDDKGVSVRSYIVLSEVPLVVLPRGPWERCEIPKADPTPVPANARTARELFVPEPSDAVWAGPNLKWRVKGTESGTVYAMGIEDKEIAVAVASGARPYKIEAAEAA